MPINDIISESVGDLGGVDAGEVADFAGDDGTTGADPVNGDAGVEGCVATSVHVWLAVMLEEKTGTLSPDCGFEFADCDPGECGLWSKEPKRTGPVMMIGVLPFAGDDEAGETVDPVPLVPTDGAN